MVPRIRLFDHSLSMRWLPLQSALDTHKNSKKKLPCEGLEPVISSIGRWHSCL